MCVKYRCTVPRDLVKVLLEYKVAEKVSSVEVMRRSMPISVDVYDGCLGGF